MMTQSVRTFVLIGVVERSQPMIAAFDLIKSCFFLHLKAVIWRCTVLGEVGVGAP